MPSATGNNGLSARTATAIILVFLGMVGTILIWFRADVSAARADLGTLSRGCENREARLQVLESNLVDIKADMREAKTDLREIKRAVNQ